MSNLILMTLGVIILLATVFAIYKFMPKKKKKKKSFMHHYHEDIIFKDVKTDEVDFEQVSVTNFNAASKGLKGHKMQIQETKPALQINPPTMGRR